MSEAEPSAVGDELAVRVELRVDRDMEYVRLKDRRGREHSRHSESFLHHLAAERRDLEPLCLPAEEVAQIRNSGHHVDIVAGATSTDGVHSGGNVTLCLQYHTPFATVRALCFPAEGGLRLDGGAT